MADVTLIFSADVSQALSALSELNRGMTGFAGKTATAAEKATAEMRKLGTNLQQVGITMRGVGLAITAISGAFIAFGAGAVNEFAKFESSFAGIVKTVDDATDEFGEFTQAGLELRDSMRQLALQLPINVNELNRIGELAGQLGIATAEIADFTEQIAILSVTTNLSSETAALSLARIRNIMGGSAAEFDKVAAAIVGLGNNFATMESEIVNFSLRIAGAGKVAGLMVDEVLAIATAMTSIGVQAEAGGTAVQRVLIKMTEAVATGNEELAVFDEVVGFTGESFKQVFERDSAEAFQRFVEGLQRAGTDSFRILKDIELGNQRTIRAFIGLAEAGTLLSRTLVQGKKDFEEGTAAQIEFDKRLRTLESRVTLVKNQFRDWAITIGEALMPVVELLLDAFDLLVPVIETMVQAFAAMPTPIKLAMAAIVGLVAVMGIAVTISGQLAFSIGQLVILFGTLGGKTALAGLTTKFGVFGRTILTFGKSLLGFGGILKAITASFGFLGVALKAVVLFFSGPVGWAVAIAAVVAALIGLSGESAAFFGILSDLWEITKNLTAVFIDWIVNGLKVAVQWLGEMLGATAPVQGMMMAWEITLERIGRAIRFVKGVTEGWAESSQEAADKLDPVAAKARKAAEAAVEFAAAQKKAQEAMKDIGKKELPELLELYDQLIETGLGTAGTFITISRRASDLVNGDLTKLPQKFQDLAAATTSWKEAAEAAANDVDPPPPTPEQLEAIEKYEAAIAKLIVTMSQADLAEQGRLMSDAFERIKESADPEELDRWAEAALKLPLEFVSAELAEMAIRWKEEQIAQEAAAAALEAWNSIEEHFLNTNAQARIDLVGAWVDQKDAAGELTEHMLELARAEVIAALAADKVIPVGLIALLGDTVIPLNDLADGHVLAAKATMDHIKAGQEWLDNIPGPFIDELGELTKGLGTLFSQLSEIGGGFGDFMKGIGGAISAFEVATKASDKFGDAQDILAGENGQVQNTTLGLTGMAQSLLASAGAFIEATGSASVFGATLGGVLTGASLGGDIGSIFGPAGAAIGAGIGAVVGGAVGLVRSLFGGPSEQELAGRDLFENVAAGFRERLSADQLIEADAAGFGAAPIIIGLRDDFLALGFSVDEANRKAAELAGKLTPEIIAGGPEMMQPIIDEMNELGEAAAEARAELAAAPGLLFGGIIAGIQGVRERFGELGSSVGDAKDKLKEAKDALKELQDQNEDGSVGAKEFREARDAIKEAREELDAAKEAGGALADEFGDDIARFENLTLAGFNAAIAAGDSFLDAIQAAGPALDELILANEELGITSDNAAIRQLINFRDLATANEGLIRGIDGMTQALSASATMGILNQDTFNDFATQATQDFDALIDAGFTVNQAMQIQGQQWSDLNNAAQEYGFTLTEDQQAMIDLADEQGVLKGEGLDMTSALVDGIGALITAVGGELPESFRRFAEEAQRSTEQVTDAVEESTDDQVAAVEQGEKDKTKAVQEAGEELVKATKGNEDAKLVATQDGVDAQVAAVVAAEIAKRSDIEETSRTQEQAARDQEEATRQATAEIEGEWQDVIAKLADVGGEMGDLESQTNNLNLSTSAFDSWAKSAVKAAREVEDAIDGVSFGGSPGGIKEIAIQLGIAEAAMDQFSSTFVGDSIQAEAAVSSVANTAPGIGSDAGGGGSVTTIELRPTFNIKALDGADVATIVEQKVFPEMVTMLRDNRRESRADLNAALDT